MLILESGQANLEILVEPISKSSQVGINVSDGEYRTNPLG
jgi:hypothetical protein